MTDLTDNTVLHRFELNAGGAIAFVTYRIAAHRLVLVHTEVPETLSGRGIGSAIARAVLDHAKSRGVHIEPECEFIASYIGRHPEYADLVAQA